MALLVGGGGGGWFGETLVWRWKERRAGGGGGGKKMWDGEGEVRCAWVCVGRRGRCDSFFRKF